MEHHSGDPEFVKLVTDALQAKLNRHAEERFSKKDGGYYNLWRSIFQNMNDELEELLGSEELILLKNRIENEEYQAHLLLAPGKTANELIRKRSIK